MSRQLSVSGVVVFGDLIGWRLGYPTANIQCNDIPAELTDGVYAARIDYNGTQYDGMLVVGDENRRKPGVKKVELHLFDFSGNLYGEKLSATVVKRIRTFRPFHSEKELIAQIAKDCAEGRKILKSASRKRL